jgi:hypothetical protein
MDKFYYCAEKLEAVEKEIRRVKGSIREIRTTNWQGTNDEKARMRPGELEEIETNLKEEKKRWDKRLDASNTSNVKKNTNLFWQILPMLSLPVEIRYSISRYLNHRDYIRLRRTCKFLLRLDSIQYLYFQSYKESVDLIGNNPNLLSQIRLNNQCLDDDSFVFIAVNGHYREFHRLIQTNKWVKISSKAKDEAFVEIIQNSNFTDVLNIYENDHSQEMICELLNDGFVDATLSVILPFVDEDFETTALHWACVKGYIDVFQVLLKYVNVDVSSRDDLEYEPIHYAAQYGHTESYSF